MKERQILFIAEMVRALLEGRKTMTRRVVRKPAKAPPGEWASAIQQAADRRWTGVMKRGSCDGIEWYCRCPYGSPGDRLWVKEGSYIWGAYVKNGLTETGRQRWRFRASTERKVLYVADPETPILSQPERGEVGWIRRPAIFMPRWASRITLEVTSVRAERLQEIAAEDIRAEGLRTILRGEPDASDDLRSQWLAGWDRINGRRAGRAWDDNPWVWVIGLRLLYWTRGIAL